MLKEQECKEWIDHNIEPLMRSLGIPHWQVDVEYGVNPDRHGDCDTLPDYERALMTLYPASIESIEQLEKTVIHELCHILHSPFARFEKALDGVFEGSDQKITTLFSNIYVTACERTVKNLERLLVAQREKYGV